MVTFVVGMGVSVTLNEVEKEFSWELVVSSLVELKVVFSTVYCLLFDDTISDVVKVEAGIDEWTVVALKKIDGLGWIVILLSKSAELTEDNIADELIG